MSTKNREFTIFLSQMLAHDVNKIGWGWPFGALKSGVSKTLDTRKEASCFVENTLPHIAQNKICTPWHIIYVGSCTRCYVHAVDFSWWPITSTQFDVILKANEKEMSWFTAGARIFSGSTHSKKIENLLLSKKAENFIVCLPLLKS